MKIMNVVWVLTALWASYLALWAYFKFGMETAPKEDGKDMDMGADMKMDMSMKDMPMDMPMGNMDRPHWQSIALSALHCGAGCTLADIIGEWITCYFPISIGGSMIIGNWVFDFILALIIGIYFQFYAIREMEKYLSPQDSCGHSRRTSSHYFPGKWVCMGGWQSYIL